VDAACPPLKALLHIMLKGSYEGKPIDDPGLRSLFTRESLLRSDWYQERLRVKQAIDIALWHRHMRAIEAFRAGGSLSPGLDVEARVALARTQMARVSSLQYLGELRGTIGADPAVRPR
jgi:hypothetical protein